METGLSRLYYSMKNSYRLGLPPILNRLSIEHTLKRLRQTPEPRIVPSHSTRFASPQVCRPQSFTKKHFLLKPRQTFGVYKGFVPASCRRPQLSPLEKYKLVSRRSPLGATNQRTMAASSSVSSDEDVRMVDPATLREYLKNTYTNSQE